MSLNQPVHDASQTEDHHNSGQKTESNRGQNEHNLIPVIVSVDALFYQHLFSMEPHPPSFQTSVSHAGNAKMTHCLVHYP